MADCCPVCKTDLVTGAEFCYACGAPVGSREPRRGVGAGRVQVARWLLVIAWCTCAVALFLIAAVDVESVIGTGPAIFLMGAALVVLGIAAGYRAAWLLGLAHCAICILFVSLVNLLSWSPVKAHLPFTVMGLIYTAVTLPLTVLAWRSAPPTRHPWECVKCGYLLYGLHDPRCPECGQPFDPARLPGRRPEADRAL